MLEDVKGDRMLTQGLVPVDMPGRSSGLALPSVFLQKIPNITNRHRILEQHVLEIPPCCPKSKNPRPRSTITIQYRPRGSSLEVGSLIRYIHTFVGGKRDADGQLEVRDMEGMICRIAQDCAVILDVPVRVTAQLIILPKQQMQLVARGYPKEWT